MICLGERWVVLQRGEVTEGCIINQIYRKGEEDLVIDEDLLARGLIWVQRSQIATNDSNGSLHSCIKEIIVDLSNSAVTLDSLHEGFFREILNDLEFLIPIADSSWVKTIQRYKCCIIGIY